MRAVDIIVRKRDGEELSTEEIDFFVRKFTSGEIPDYQAAAWAMAVLLQGMTSRETADLTLAMAASGEQLDLTQLVPRSVDKHSTGGVGDKTSLVVLPAVAACGLPVGKMSGRGLGFSGGTLDKMESIPGYRADLTTQQFLKQLAEVGLVLSGQSVDLAPADGKLYALRDVTGTVPSIPLIASSVMSKKIAAGAKAIVLDVKVGSGAFMRDLEQAEQLAALMVDIGQRAGRAMVAVISDMNQPLGNAVGNALELAEALETLSGGGPADFREHCLEIGGHMLALGGKAADLADAKGQIASALENGQAMARFRALVEAQGGDVAYLDQPERLPRAALIREVESPQTGFLGRVQAREIGLAAVDLGAGRSRKGEQIDHAVGIVVHHKVGDRVEAGETLFSVHANDEARLESAVARVMAAHVWSDRAVEPLPLFYATIQSAGLSSQSL